MRLHHHAHSFLLLLFSFLLFLLVSIACVGLWGPLQQKSGEQGVQKSRLLGRKKSQLGFFDRMCSFFHHRCWFCIFCFRFNRMRLFGAWNGRETGIFAVPSLLRPFGVLIDFPHPPKDQKIEPPKRYIPNRPKRKEKENASGARILSFPPSIFSILLHPLFKDYRNPCPHFHNWEMDFCVFFSLLKRWENELG